MVENPKGKSKGKIFFIVSVSLFLIMWFITIKGDLSNAIRNEYPSGFP
ncbi:hypothetical protein V7087_28045 [Neobacillus niacini]